MSLIKAVDVPKYMADRLLSRRIGARLSGGVKQPAASLPVKPVTSDEKSSA